MRQAACPHRQWQLAHTFMTPNPCHPQTAPGGFGHAWPALLALTQANRDAAAALLLAMQTYGDPTGHAMQSDELHCWYTDAHDAAEVASQAAVALKRLTTSDKTGTVGVDDAAFKLGGNLDTSITGAALVEDLRYTNAHDAAEMATHTTVALKRRTTSDKTGAVGVHDAGLKFGGIMDVPITHAARVEDLPCPLAHESNTTQHTLLADMSPPTTPRCRPSQ